MTEEDADDNLSQRLESEAHAAPVYIWSDLRLNLHPTQVKDTKWQRCLKRIEHKLPSLSINNTLDFVIKQISSSGSYTGQIFNSQREGIGYMKYIKGIKYYGEWKNNLPNGQGYLYISKEKYYRGRFVLGKFNGYGEFFDGEDYYKGNWVNDQKHGEGEEKAGENSYIGQFRNGKKNGKGRLRSGSGTYKGSFENDMPNVGKFKAADKSYSYSGDWFKKSSSIQGFIKCHNSPYKHIRGHFRSNTLIDGTVTFSDNKTLKILSSKSNNH